MPESADPRRLPYPDRLHLAGLAAGYLGAGAGVLGLALLTIGAGASSSAARGAVSVTAVSYALVTAMAFLGVLGWLALDRPLRGLRWVGAATSAALGVFLLVGIVADVGTIGSRGPYAVAIAGAAAATLLLVSRQYLGRAALVASAGLVLGAIAAVAGATTLATPLFAVGYGALAFIWMGEQEHWESPAPRW